MIPTAKARRFVALPRVCHFAYYLAILFSTLSQSGSAYEHHHSSPLVVLPKLRSDRAAPQFEVTKEKLAQYSFALVVPSLSDPAFLQARIGTELSVERWNKELAPQGFQLRLSHVIESQRSSWLTISSLAAAVASRDDELVAISGLVSSGIVRAVTPISQVAQLATLSIAASDVDLTDGIAPNFFRLSQPNGDLATAMVEVVLSYGWTEVVLLHSDSFNGAGFRSRFLEAAAGHNIAVKLVFDIADNGEDSPSAQTEDSLRSVATNGSRIIVTSLPLSTLEQVLRVAKSLDLLSAGYAWICAQLDTGTGLMSEELATNLNGTLWLRPNVGQKARQAFVSQLASRDDALVPHDDSVLSLHSMYAYDSVTAIARAVAKCHGKAAGRAGTVTGNTKSLSGLTMQPTAMSSCVLHCLRSVKITSVTGELIDFAKPGDRKAAEYDLVNPSQGTSVRVGEWTDQRRLDISTDAVIQWPGNNTLRPTGGLVFGHTLKVLVPISKPFGYVPGFQRTRGSSDIIPEFNFTNEDFSGVAIDFFKAVAARAGFRYELHLYPFETWTKMVALVGDETSPWDMAVGSITVNKARAQTANYTCSIYLSGLRMLVLRPTEVNSSLWAFILPLDWSLWVTLIGMFFFVGVLMIALDRDGVTYQKNDCGLPISDSMFFSFSSFFFTQESDNIQKPFGRVFISVVLFVVLILVAAYTAQLSYYLSMRTGQEPVEEFSDLHTEWVGIRFGGTSYVYVTQELGFRNIRVVGGVADALAALRNGSIAAYIADIPHLEAIVATECDTMLNGRLIFTQQYAFVAKKNASWLSEVDKAISVLLNKGVIAKNFRDAVPNMCPEVVSIDTIKPLTMKDLLSLVILVGVTAGVSVIGKLFVLLTRKRQRKRRVSSLAGVGALKRPSNAEPSSDWPYKSDSRDSGVSSMLSASCASRNSKDAFNMRRASSFGSFKFLSDTAPLVSNAPKNRVLFQSSVNAGESTPLSASSDGVFDFKQTAETALV
ncbi:uncharacterized protein LOC135814896 [Sycon ciliatum]|uniref:uncharacterized protein LOC135814896 n=1 Tax=Sycon ciliatum TaxID=27933 RepID=UPI0031F69920